MSTAGAIEWPEDVSSSHDTPSAMTVLGRSAARMTLLLAELGARSLIGIPSASAMRLNTWTDTPESPRSTADSNDREIPARPATCSWVNRR